jgi:mono/diheme cytochrome c family protein
MKEIRLTLALLPAIAVPSLAQSSPAPAAQVAEGKKQYMMICVACHQPTGMGLPAVFPPLTKSEYVNGPGERLVAMVLKGNAGPMTIDGKPFNNIMPGQEMLLKDEQIAAVLTYVRQNFGNNAPPLTSELVALTRKKYADRKTPWTQAELNGWKDDGAISLSSTTAPAGVAAAAPAQ